jgi:hypothetical protein
MNWLDDVVVNDELTKILTLLYGMSVMPTEDEPDEFCNQNQAQ